MSCSPAKSFSLTTTLVLRTVVAVVRLAGAAMMSGPRKAVDTAGCSTTEVVTVCGGANTRRNGSLPAAASRNESGVQYAGRSEERRREKG